jgi:hypothetical protein
MTFHFARDAIRATTQGHEFDGIENGDAACTTQRRGDEHQK